jgi:hypothetical protein
VGQNGAGKTTIAKLLCRFYDVGSGAIEIDGVDVRTLDVDSWRTRLTAVFQDFLRLELPLRDNVAPTGAPDEVIRKALEAAGAASLASLDTVLARGATAARISRAGSGSACSCACALRRLARRSRRVTGPSRRRLDDARRGGNLRAGAGCHAALHHHPSSHIAFRPCGRPIGSVCWNMARSSSSGRMTS